MADTKEPVRKKGLHGWRAAVAVFGCGTVAAFGVFGALVGVASLFLSGVANGVGGNDNQPRVAMTGEPIAELDPGALDLCAQDVQYAYGQPDSNYSSGNYEDPALGGNVEDRTVRDECEWEIYPQGSVPGQIEPWRFSYTYEAVISTSDGIGPDEVASNRFDELVSDLSQRDYEILESGEANLSERSYYYYSVAPSGGYAYYLVGQTRSTVYAMTFEAPAVNGEVSSARFANEADHVASFVEHSLNAWVPE
ncbi:hypothetical protein KIK06_28070 [Nocardiopsis sp. EMB25]|uniref:hypothetical protein n=1 Tax=Nocardiopsis sp. EMB25 TaxID=2835867 RepID=UPI0022840B4B|nr:hypothetical protein [Nocardiopsis sp. EMB25]MCY9787741.1 hypothetical protein [Nocardiopsis sp. EMB25]